MAKSDKKEDMKVDLKQDKKMIASAVHKHERADHPGKPLTKLAKGGKTTNTQTLQTRGSGAATKGTKSSTRMA